MKDVIAELLAPLIAALNNIAKAGDRIAEALLSQNAAQEQFAEVMKDTMTSNTETLADRLPGPTPPEEKPVKATRKKAEPKPVEPETDPVLTPETEYEPEPEGEKVWTLPELTDMVRPITDDALRAKVKAMLQEKFDAPKLAVLAAENYPAFVEELNKIMDAEV